MRVIIADDEKPARQRFLRLLAAFSDIQVVGEGASGKEAIELVRDQNPDVAFLDIEMPGLSGLEAAAVIAETRTMVVFVTAFDRFAVDAFESNAVDYLVKPVEQERLERTIERLKSRLDNTKPDQHLSNLLAELTKQNRLERIAFRNGSKIEVVALTSISLVNALDGYAEIFHGEKKSLSDESLDALAKKLGPAFFRVHRSAIINLDYLSELIREGDRKYLARLNDHYGNEVAVSREALKHLQERLGLKT